MFKQKLSTIFVGIIVVLFAIIGVYAIGSLCKYYYESQFNKDQNQKLWEQFHETKPGQDPIPTPVPGNTDPIDDDTKAWLKDKYDEMKSINSDYAFWLNLIALEQEYPVCFSKEGDEYYYLLHDFYGNENKNGCIYMSANCNIRSENFILYGHCMHTGQMFGSLHKYLDAEWAKNNRLICIYMEDEYRYYEVISVFTCDMSAKPFNWERYTDFTSPGLGVRYGQMAVDASTIDFGYTPGKYADRFITLVTCEYTHNDGRLIVVARELGRPTVEEVDWSDYD